MRIEEFFLDESYLIHFVILSYLRVTVLFHEIKQFLKAVWNFWCVLASALSTLSPLKGVGKSVFGCPPFVNQKPGRNLRGQNEMDEKPNHVQSGEPR